MEYGKCATESTNKLIPAKEHTRKLTINNPAGKLVRTIKVDKCLFDDSDPCKRCDYMFEIFDKLDIEKLSGVIYLELKGRHIEEAYNQLVATIERYSNKQHKGVKKECHIVASRVPKAGPEVQQLQVKMLKSKQAKLTVSTIQGFVSV
jgi:hypothetical protein